MKNKAKQFFANPFLWLFLVTSGMFGLLFIRFIFGEYAYFYTDMGADTFDINYPLYCLFSQVFHGNGYEDYFLNVGLGMDMSSYLFQYLNPINLLVVMLPEHLIPWSVLLATYIKLLVISTVGYKLFYRWIHHKWGAFTAALLWTFSSYVMLWGQHYGFCTSMMMFTVFLYLVHLFVDDEEKSGNWLLILWITLMLFTNYYFLYMSGILGAVYVVIWLCFQHRWKRIPVKIAGLAGMGILGICIGGVCLIPTWNIFQSSTRAAAVNMNNPEYLFHPVSAKWLFGFLARMFSNNTMGIADNYSGAGNYYEMAMLFTSSLFFLALPYLLMKKKMRLKTLFLTALSVIALILPATGKLFTMNAAVQRWSFILCMLEALAVGMFIRFLFTEKNRERVRLAVAIGLALMAFSYALLFYGQKEGYFELEIEYLLTFAMFLFVFSVLAMAKGKYAGLDCVIPVLLTVVLCGELLIANYPCINFRENPTREQVVTQYYQDGTRQVYEALKEQDSSLYRVAKTYESASENDSLAQGYPGLSCYLTTNPKELVEIKEMFGAEGISDNFVSFDNDNFILNSLLGMKYLLANPENTVSAKNYKKIGMADRNGTAVWSEDAALDGKAIYENNHALPFGYLYENVWSQSELEKMSETDKTLALLHGFYFTDERSESVYHRTSREEGTERSLLKKKVQASDCKIKRTSDGITISDMESDPFITMDNVQSAFKEGAVHTITVEMDVDEKVDMALYYQTEGDTQFSQDKIYIFKVSPKKTSWTYLVPGDITSLRLDVSTETDDVTVKDIRVNNCESDNAAYEKLKNSEVTKIAYEGNTYTANVSNSSGRRQMLCVPLLYSEGWTAVMDGKETDLYSINSGLCGIEIPSGSHQVSLSYEVPHRAAGIALSGVGVVIYLILLIYWTMQRRKNR